MRHNIAMAKRYLVVGGMGLIGRAVVAALEEDGVPVVALSRRSPDWATSATWLSLDLTDRAACSQALSNIGEFSHVVYCALFEQPSLIAGWQDEEQIATNAQMLANVLDFVEPTRHLTLLQGTKAYAAHLRPMSLPGKESQPRPEGANFYWNQEDDVRQRQRDASWSFSILRPQVVCGVATGSPMNVVAAIGAYGALCGHLQQPFAFSGGGEFVTEPVDADLVAQAVLWAGSTPKAAGETYNVTNGDIIHWPSLWPELARTLGLVAAEPQPQLLQQVMPEREEAWRAIVAAHNLAPLTLKGLVGSSWQFADAVFGSGGGARSTLLSTIKIRQHGFIKCIDSAEMFDKHLSTMRKLRWIP